MSKVCQLTGKRPLSGHHVSHSNRKTNRRFMPILQTKKYLIPETGEWITLKLATSTMRTIDKYGIYAYLKSLEKAGTLTGLKLS